MLFNDHVSEIKDNSDEKFVRMSISEINSMNFRINKYFKRKRSGSKFLIDDATANLKLDELTGKIDTFTTYVTEPIIKTLYTELDRFYKLLYTQIIQHQSLATGLFPIFSKQVSTEGHVRDTIYCAISVWSLRQCYSKVDDDKGRTHHLGQVAVKAMRGILFCWMRQAHKLERYKLNQLKENALHCKFNIVTGEELDNETYGHLQLDSIALYLVTLTQMISSGLQIIFSTDEVNFVQGLVFYIERAYRTPDYGMFERGTKYNNDECELHASSIGMVKAALESMNGFNLYGDAGCSWSVVYVDIDAHNRNRSTLETLLPRESSSKVRFFFVRFKIFLFFFNTELFYFFFRTQVSLFWPQSVFRRFLYTMPNLRIRR